MEVEDGWMANLNGEGTDIEIKGKDGKDNKADIIDIDDEE